MQQHVSPVNDRRVVGKRPIHGWHMAATRVASGWSQAINWPTSARGKQAAGSWAGCVGTIWLALAICNVAHRYWYANTNNATTQQQNWQITCHVVVLVFGIELGNRASYMQHTCVRCSREHVFAQTTITFRSTGWGSKASPTVKLQVSTSWYGCNTWWSVFVVLISCL